MQVVCISSTVHLTVCIEDQYALVLRDTAPKSFKLTFLKPQIKVTITITLIAYIYFAVLFSFPPPLFNLNIRVIGAKA